MLIDWFTVIAQVINFLILVWLMKRFLYKPILNAIDEREKQVSAKITDADNKKKDAIKESKDLEVKIKKFDEKRDELLQKANKDAEKERDKIIEGARNEADDLKQKQQDDLKKEVVKFYDNITHQMQKEIYAVARKTLKDLADINLETHMLNVFLVKIKELEGDKLEVLKSSNEIVIHSAFEMTKEQQAKVEKTINDLHEMKGQIRFEILPDLISGIELVMNDQKVLWCINSYLTSLEKEVSAITSAKDEKKDVKSGAL